MLRKRQVLRCAVVFIQALIGQTRGVRKNETIIGLFGIENFTVNFPQQLQESRGFCMLNSK